ncbi:MAG: hypothetical protein ACRC8W_03285 [Plesiomonas shigelloides]
MNTNNTFTLIMPTDDPIALNAFSRALHEMAVAHGAPVVQVTEPVPAKMVMTDGERAALENVNEFLQAMTPIVNNTTVLTDEEFDALTEPQNDLIDSEGLPWDERIHAGSKTRNQDGTWKARKKRQDMSAEEWSDYVTGVKAELKELMNVPVVPVAAAGSELDALAVTPPVPTPDPEVVPAVVDDVVPVPPVPAVEPPAVVDMPVPPVPVVEPEVTVAIEAEQLPPVPPAPPVSDSVTTFPALMTWLTSHESVLTVERVNQVVQSHGLTELKQLIQRPDLIPQVFVTLSQEV